MSSVSESEAIRDALRQASLPEIVAETSLRLDVDSTGAPAVWIWVVVEDAAAASETFPSVAAGIRDSIREAVQRTGIDRWPYVRFRTRSEKAQLARESAA